MRIFPDSFFDVAIGNVPFGQFKVSDKRYDKNNFLIHDYFFGKALDKVRPGGVIAFITSKGTMDKESTAVRKYIAQRAELLGAIRLPNNAFKANAGTEVTSDIIFLQKRDRIMDITPDWVHTGKDENGISMNEYFISHPQMILGKMENVSLGHLAWKPPACPFPTKALRSFCILPFLKSQAELPITKEKIWKMKLSLFLRITVLEISAMPLWMARFITEKTAECFRQMSRKRHKAVSKA